MTPMLACDNLREDHREMETYLDQLIVALEHLSIERISEVRTVVMQIQQLAGSHFAKEEEILYPRLRLILPEVLDQMDRQHDVVREVEMHVTGMLADPPQAPEPRWLNELRRPGTEFYDHIQHIQHHIVEEEDQLFRLAEERLTIEEHADLAKAMTAVQSRNA